MGTDWIDLQFNQISIKHCNIINWKTYQDQKKMIKRKAFSLSIYINHMSTQRNDNKECNSLPLPCFWPWWGATPVLLRGDVFGRQHITVPASTPHVCLQYLGGTVLEWLGQICQHHGQLRGIQVKKINKD